MNDSLNVEPSSFRDPSGQVFWQDSVLYRQINQCYAEHYEALLKSGLYDKLVEKSLLIEHEEVESGPTLSDAAYKVVTPTRIPFLSYPYEWCFGQLKAAALATLEIQRCALNRGMILKDASAYNIQFIGTKPVLIDTLSFETYEEGGAWVAYHQFCQHFLAPLSLMACVDIRLGQLSQLYIDGVPLDLASTLLPKSTWLSFSLLSHVHLQSKAAGGFSAPGSQSNPVQRRVSKEGLLGLVDSLGSSVAGLKWRAPQSLWADYYTSEHNYGSDGLTKKEELVNLYLDQMEKRSGLVIDLGSNTGRFSRLASTRGFYTVSIDLDSSCVELNYQQSVKENEQRLLPLHNSIANPTPSLGWACSERQSLLDRGPADLTLALALMHHLAISNNVPFDSLASFFAKMSYWLIIEFIPKEDPQTQRLLRGRVDVFKNYDLASFERAFQQDFEVKERREVPGSDGRLLYLLKRIKA